MEGHGAASGLGVARLMRGALMLSAASTPYRRAGFAFAKGVPLMTAIASLAVIQLRQLLEDPAITVLVGQDNGQYVVVPKFDGDMTDEELQSFIDQAPPVEIGEPAPVANEELGLLELQREFALRTQALTSMSDQLADQQQANRTLTSDLTVARDDIAAKAGRITDLEAQLAAAQADGALFTKRIAELEDDLAKAAKPTVKATGKPKPAE